MTKNLLKEKPEKQNNWRIFHAAGDRDCEGLRSGGRSLRTDFVSFKKRKEVKRNASLSLQLEEDGFSLLQIVDYYRVMHILLP